MKLGRIIRVLACLCAMASAGMAHAQASRTWVSGVGDDANPCSRTAPCKTFAGAISKTATGGEINTLDAGGFGGVTITKAITIASEGTGEAGVLVSGTNGIVVNAPAGSFVNLRGLQIEGLGTGLSGVLVLGGDVYIDNCVIRNFRGSPGVGVNSQPSGSARVTIANSVIMGNQIGVNAAPAVVNSGIAIENSSIASNLQYGLLGTGTYARYSLDRVSIKGNPVGISAPSPAKVYSFGNNAINSIDAGTVLTLSPLQ